MFQRFVFERMCDLGKPAEIEALDCSLVSLTVNFPLTLLLNLGLKCGSHNCSDVCTDCRTVQTIGGRNYRCIKKIQNAQFNNFQHFLLTQSLRKSCAFHNSALIFGYCVAAFNNYSVDLGNVCDKFRQCIELCFYIEIIITPNDKFSSGEKVRYIFLLTNCLSLKWIYIR